MRLTCTITCPPPGPYRPEAVYGWRNPDGQPAWQQHPDGTITITWSEQPRCALPGDFHGREPDSISCTLEIHGEVYLLVEPAQASLLLPGILLVGILATCRRRLRARSGCSRSR